MTDKINRKNKRSLLAFLTAAIGFASLGMGLSGITRAAAESNPDPVAEWALAAEGTDYSVTGTTITEVCGVSGSNLQTDAMLWRQDTSASSDTSTNLIYCPSTALDAARAAYAIHFTQNADKRIGTDVNTVIVRLYAHLTSDGSAYFTANGGIRLYAPDDTGENDSGYMIPGDIAQNQWVDLVISGEDLAGLADSNGYFSGFTAGNSKISNLLGNNGWGYTDAYSWIAFESFTAYDEYYVTFDDGTTTTGQLVSADTPIIAPAVEKEGYVLIGWYDENGVKVDLSAGVKNSCTLTAKWQLANETPDPVAEWALAVEMGDYQLTQDSVNLVNGKTVLGDSLLANRTTSAGTFMTYGVSSAVDVSHSYYQVNLLKNTNNAFGTDFNTLVVRVYAHLTADGSSYSILNGGGGIRIYAANDTRESNSGYMIPTDIVQDQWVDLYISGVDLQQFAGTTSAFTGFTVGSDGISGTNILAGNGWAFTDEVAWIAFESFTAYKEYYVTFDDGTTTTWQLVSADTPITPPAVEKEGYVLIGWYDENGVKVDLSAGVKSSCTLTAKWQPANGTLKSADGNGYNDASQTNRKVNEVYGAALTVPDMMFWKSASDVGRSDAPSGYPIYSASTNHVGASPTITFGGAALSLKNTDGTWKSIVVRVYAHLTTDKSAYYTENGGIRLYGSDDDGTNNSGYMIPANVPQDQWVYLEISGDDVAKLADKNGDFSGFAVGSNVNGGASGETGKKMYPGGSWSAEGSYVLFDTFTVGSYVVTFRNGGEVTTQLVASNGSVSKPDPDPTKENYTFGGWYTENGTPYTFGSPVTGSFTLIPKWIQVDGVLSSATTGDYVFEASTLSRVAGFADIGEGAFIPDGPLSVMTYATTENLNAKDSAINAALADATNASAFVYKTHSWGIQRAQNAVRFAATSNVNEVDALIVRVYAHLSSGATYNTNFGGIMLYPLGADGTSGGFQIPADVVQDQWVELILTGENLAAIAQNGVLNGFQIGSGFRSSNNSMAYMGTANEDNGAWILIDSIAAVKGYTITYLDSDGTTVLKDETVYQGKTVTNLFVPEKDGKVFVGWKQNGGYYDFNQPVRSDVELTVSWENAADLNDAANNGFYKKGSEFITILDGYTEFSSGLITDLSQVVSVQLAEGGILYVVSRSGVQSFVLGAGEFEKQPYCVITYDRGDGTVLRQVVEQGGFGRELPDKTLERLGYIFNVWKMADGSEFAYGQTQVSTDITVYADWNYDCVSENEYAWYYGTYYDRESGAIIILKEGNNAVYNGREYKYYILVSDELVVELNGKTETFNATMYSTKIAAGGVNYYRLKTYKVVFDTDGGSAVDSLTVGSGQNWKITKPDDPVKEGYVFKGWYLADGTEYNFDTIVSGGFTLFAHWDAVENAGSGCSGTIQESSAVIIVVALACIAVVIKFRKKRRGD